MKYVWITLLLGGCASNGDWASVDMRRYLNSEASIEGKIEAIRDNRVPRGALPVEALPYLMQPSGIVTCSRYGTSALCF